MKIEKNIRLFHISSLIFEFCRSTFFGISSIFLLDTLGLQLYQIGLIKLFNPITIAIFEIPSGMIADKFGRKLCFTIANIVSSIGFLIYAFSHNFWHAVLGEIFYSMGLAFNTGSLDALIISQAKEKNMPISPIISRDFALRTIGTLLGGTFGIILSYKSLRLPWLIASMIYPINALIPIFIDGNLKTTKKMLSLKEGFKEYFNNKNLILLTILSLGITLVNIPFFNFWQIFMEKRLGVSRNSLGFIAIYIFYNILIAIGGLSITYLNNRIGHFKTLSISAFVTVLSSIFMVLGNNKTFGILNFLVSEYARGVYFPSFNSTFNNFIPDTNRSLFLSTLSLFMRLFSILTYIVSTVIATKTDNIAINIYSISLVGLVLVTLSLYMLSKIQKNN